jgi:hypothetical protein
MIALSKHNKKITVLWKLGIIDFNVYAYFANNEINPEYRSNISLVTSQEIITVSIVLIALAILSVILKGSTNRLTNIIGGSVLAIGFIAVLIDAVTVKFTGIYNIMMGVEVIIMILIIVFAYRIPKTQT